MKKSIIFMLAAILMLTIACNEDQPTKVNIVTYDKHTVLGDSDWVEVTDIDTINACIAYEIFYGGILVKNEDEYKTLFKKNPEYFTDKAKDSIKYPCYFIYEPPELDMRNRDLLLYSLYTGGGQPTHTMYLLKNTKIKQYLFLIKVEPISHTFENSGVIERLSIPKIESDYTIKFDTLYIRH